MERFNTDFVVPMKTESVGKSNLFVTLFDDFSGFLMVNILAGKKEAANHVKVMIK